MLPVHWQLEARPLDFASTSIMWTNRLSDRVYVLVGRTSTSSDFLTTPGSESQSSNRYEGQPHFVLKETVTERFTDPAYREKLIKGLPLTKMFPCPEPIGAAHNCQYYSYDWENKTDIGQLLTNRMSLIK